MKQLRRDLNFQQTYGSMPDSFEHRVQYALRQTQEEHTMKRPMLRTVAIVLVLLTFTTAACAAILSHTREVFGRIYPFKSNQLNQGEVAVSGATFELGGVLFTLDDAVWTDTGLYAVGTMRPLPDQHIILLSEDHLIDDPAGYIVHYPSDEVIPEDAPTYRQLAEATGATLIMPTCHFANQISKDFPDIIGTPGAGYYPRSDGSILFATEFDLAGAPLEALRSGKCRICFDIYVNVLNGEGEQTAVCFDAVWEVPLIPQD